ncbi:MAG: DUF805 domain-containing protein [Proteobacteria bacterium]|nr:DUF805 domain-containing protein [Pseudomonadota bacterium]
MINSILYLFWQSITKKYFQLKGRANRKEYISFILVEMNIILVIDLVILLTKDLSIVFIPVTIRAIIDLILFVPSMTIIVRRLHDLNLNGFWFLVDVPIIIYCYLYDYYYINIISGLIFGSVLLLFKGTQGTNKYGDEPKY